MFWMANVQDHLEKIDRLISNQLAISNDIKSIDQKIDKHQVEIGQYACDALAELVNK